MKLDRTASLLASMCLGAALTFSLGALAHDPSAHDPKEMKPMEMKTPHAMSGHSEGSMELHKLMTDGMKMPMTMTGNVDKDFATMMSMHHEMAIKMVDVLLRHGSNAELKALASKMKAAQKDEIKKMAPFKK